MAMRLSHQPAIVQATGPPGSLEICQTGPFPKLQAHQALIKVAAVALNPCDWKMPTRVPCPGAVDGSDFSGTVVELGNAVNSGLKIGDRVAGAQHGSNPIDRESGAFKEYITAAADQIWRLPPALSWEEGAAIGLAVVSSVGMALWVSLKLQGTPEKPVSRPEFVLVYGGATASGTIAIQLLKMSGYRVVTTCSPRNMDLVKSYGAEEAFDYHLPNCGQEIRDYCKNTLRYALDIITEVKTIQHCHTAVGRAGGRYTGFEALPEDFVASLRKAVKSDWVLGLEMSGAEIGLPGQYYRKPNPELRAWCCNWIKQVEQLVSSGRLRSNPVNANDGGLEAILVGVEAMRRKEVSAQKLVYRMVPSIQDPLAASTVTNAGMRAPMSIAEPSNPPRVQRGLKVITQNQVELQHNIPLPQPKHDEILVRVRFISLNPVDAKSVDLSPAPGATLGCDFSGEVIAMDPSLKTGFVIGDLVCGCVFGCNPDDLDTGAFAEYVSVNGNLLFKVPSQLSLQSAATLPIGLGTVGMLLYQELSLPLPMHPPPASNNKSDYILVYGGSTATGRLAIQMARMSGFIPIATCSPHSIREVMSLGAKRAFDYRDPTCGDDIRSFTNDTLELVVDCISDAQSAATIFSAIRSSGTGRCVAVEPYPSRSLTRSDIDTSWVLLFTIFGKSINWKPPFRRDPRPKDLEFAKGWFRHVQKLLDDGAIIAPRFEEKAGGLEAVIDGLSLVQKGRLKGVKLVYKV